MGRNLPGSSVHKIFQARIPEWIAISYSKGSSQPRDWTHVSCISCIVRWILYHCIIWETHEGKKKKNIYIYRHRYRYRYIHTHTHVHSPVQSLSRVRLFVTPWTAARQASLSITNSRSLFKLMSIESAIPSNHPLLLLPSIFPSIRVFSSESVLCIR